MPRFPSDTIGPSPDPGVVRELKGIEPNLYVIWRNYAFDATTPHGEVLTYKKSGKPIPEPGWRVCLKRDGEPRDAVLFCWTDDEGNPLPLDKRVPAKIRSDVARHMSPEEVMGLLRDQREREAFLKEFRRAEELAEFKARNKRKIREAMDNASRSHPEKAMQPSGEMRDARIYGFEGQKSRATPGQVSSTPKEAGWDIPWAEEE